MSCSKQCFDKAGQYNGHDDCSTSPGRDAGPIARRTPCPCQEVMGEFVCHDKTQCWEPRGELGKNEAHIVVAGDVPNTI